MITRIAIENFKGIGERVEIPIRPLTLFFGPNSAGKSTVMHAFHYAREVFERHNLDADRTIAGGDFIDLGGFRNFVHNHDVTKEVKIRIDLSLDDVAWARYSPGEISLTIFDSPWRQELKTSWGQVTIAWDDLYERPFVRKYEVGINGQLVGLLEAAKTNVVLRYFNFEHPVFGPAAKDVNDPVSYSPLAHLMLSAIENVSVGEGDYKYMLDVEQRDALPPCGQPLQVYLGDRASVQPGYDRDSDKAGDQREFINVLSQVFVRTAEVIRDELRGFCYVGPLRETPGRQYAPPRFEDPSRWATGLGAWDLLYSVKSKEDQDLLGQVNRWISDKECLNTGYSLSRKDYRLLDPETSLYGRLVGQRVDEIDEPVREVTGLPSQRRLELVTDAGLPVAIQDVGEGIAQVLPVVVAVLHKDARVVQIEEPGLLLHPAQRASLGDLLIYGALGPSPKAILAETHCEHMVLRLLRRIRETSRGEKPFMDIPVTPDQVAVYYVRMVDGQSKLIAIDIDDKGEFVQPWPDDFFEIDFHERFA